MSEKMDRQEAVEQAVTWAVHAEELAVHAEELAYILRRADEGDAGAMDRSYDKGPRLNAAIAMANMWANVAAVLDVEPTPETAVTSEEQLQAAQWLKDDGEGLWEMRKGWYYLNGWRVYSLGRSFEEIQHRFGPLTIAEDPNP